MKNLKNVGAAVTEVRCDTGGDVRGSCSTLAHVLYFVGTNPGCVSLPLATQCRALE